MSEGFKGVISGHPRHSLGFAGAGHIGLAGCDLQAMCNAKEAAGGFEESESQSLAVSSVCYSDGLGFGRFAGLGGWLR